MTVKINIISKCILDLPVILKDSNSSTSSKLPTIRELVNNCDTSFIEEIFNTNEDIGVKSEYAMDTDQIVTDNIEVVEGGKLEPLISRHIKFMDNLEAMKLGDICSAIAQLCHMDSGLAEKIWLVLFPAIWESLNSTQKTVSIQNYFNAIILFIMFTFYIYSFILNHQVNWFFINLLF